MNNYIKYSGLGFQMIVILGIFAFAGYKIDQYMHHDVQWVTAIMALAGILASFYVVFKSLKN